MTYTVSSGTLNPSIPYHFVCCIMLNTDLSHMLLERTVRVLPVHGSLNTHTQEMTGVLRAHIQLCWQRHLWGYRSRTLKLTLTLTQFLTLTRTLFWKKKRHRNIGQHSYIYRLFTKGRGWVYQRPISEKAEVFLLWMCACKTF